MGQEGSIVTTRMKEDICTLNGQEIFLWTLDPNMSAMLIAAMVVCVGADNKGFVGNSSGRSRQGVFPYASLEFK